MRLGGEKDAEGPYLLHQDGVVLRSQVIPDLEINPQQPLETIGHDASEDRALDPNVAVGGESPLGRFFFVVIFFLRFRFRFVFVSSRHSPVLRVLSPDDSSFILSLLLMYDYM